MARLGFRVCRRAAVRALVRFLRSEEVSEGLGGIAAMISCEGRVGRNGEQEMLNLRPSGLKMLRGKLCLLGIIVRLWDARDAAQLNPRRSYDGSLHCSRRDHLHQEN
jgi:hypothetical protein